jgi:hypothetical protein
VQPSECKRQGVKDYQHQPEWGGETVSRRYFATAVAKILAERLGDHVGKFLELVDKTDPAEIIALLRGSVQAAVSEGTSGSGGACRSRPTVKSAKRRMQLSGRFFAAQRLFHQPYDD